MKIIIPTYRRNDRQFTLRCIPESWHDRTVLVCDDEDAPGLQKKTKKTDIEVMVVPDRIKSIAQKRAWIIKEFAGERIVMFDDDLRFCRRDYNKTPTFLKQCDEDDVDLMLQLLERKLGKFAHVGVSARQGNNNLESMQRNRMAKERGEGTNIGKADEKAFLRWEPNSRMIYALGYNTDVLLKHCELGRIEHREDMDYCLQLLSAGYQNRVLAEFCVDQSYGAGPGGAKLERTMEASNKDAEKLAKLHPGLVKVVEKDYKLSTPRKEVICYWKKAYQGSQK
jgi:hypothetical protein